MSNKEEKVNADADVKENEEMDDIPDEIWQIKHDVYRIRLFAGVIGEEIEILKGKLERIERMLDEYGKKEEKHEY